MSKIRIPQAVFDQIKRFADERSIPVNDAVKMFVQASQAQAVVGAGGGPHDFEMPDPTTIMETGEGRMPQITEPYEHYKDGELDDFEELDVHRQRALAAAGGDTLAAEVIYRERVAAADAAAAKNNPSSVGNPLSAAGAFLGSSKICLAGAQVQPVATWTGSDADATAITVTLSPSSLPIIGGGGGVANPFARVIYGVAGITNIVEVDIGKGVQFTLGASAAQVLVGLDGDGTVGGNITQTLAGQLSFTPCVRTKNLTRSFSNVGQGANSVLATRSITVGSQVGSGTNPTIARIPAFAKDITMVVSDGSTFSSTFQLQFYSVDGTFLGGVNGNTSGTNNLVAIPLPPNCDNVTLDNTSANTFPLVTFIFGLAL